VRAEYFKGHLGEEYFEGHLGEECFKGHLGAEYFKGHLGEEYFGGHLGAEYFGGQGKIRQSPVLFPGGKKEYAASSAQAGEMFQEGVTDESSKPQKCSPGHSGAHKA
jgi:hypothetical protein